MKISTTWTQADWNNALKKVWQLSRNFEEILNFGLERGYITSSDIIHASDIYKDPYHEYSDEEVKEVIQSRGISEMVNFLEEEYSCGEIVTELGDDNVLDCFSDEELYDKIENSSLIEDVKQEAKDECYHEYIDEWIDELKDQEKDFIGNVRNFSADDLHTLICDIIGCGYCDEKSLKEGLNKFKERLNKNCYKVKYDTKESINKS